jgi:uncharacterized protein (DUF2235 family)
MLHVVRVARVTYASLLLRRKVQLLPAACLPRSRKPSHINSLRWAAFSASLFKTMSEAEDPLPAGKSQYIPKKLIVCCDGTWKDSGSGIFSGTGLSWLWRGEEQIPTNITKICRVIQPLDASGRQQVIYYQAGVGSSGNIIQRIIGGALGSGLAANIREAYAYIATNYVEGDEIYLIGFSRGAFTARSVGGMIGDFGMLTRDGLDHLVDIYEEWVNAGSSRYTTLFFKDKTGFSLKTISSNRAEYIAAYRAELARLNWVRKETVPIKAIAVWETVGSLGVPVNPVLQRFGLPMTLRQYRFYNTDLGSNVENAFQALALDEARSAYRPAVWQKVPGVNANLKQTWFPGVHSNVGGGYADSGLSDITLAWMMSNLDPFLTFDQGFVRRQWQANQEYLKRQSVPKSGLKWAASQLKNKASGLISLIGIRRRAPGRYHVLNKKSLIVETGEPLKNTHEHIHVSVRSRQITGGLNSWNRVVKYEPKSLKKGLYELQDPNAEPGKASWTYIGREKPFHGKEVPEDQLGVFEKEIFEDHVTEASA